MVMRPLRRTLFPAPFRAKQLPLHFLRHHPLFATIVYALSNPIAKPKSASSVKSASRAISTLMVWPSFTLADFITPPDANRRFHRRAIGPSRSQASVRFEPPSF
jgi:hypothetical protein